MNLIKILSISGLLSIAQLAQASEINDTFTAGNPLAAAQMNNIKSAVNDNNSRVTTNGDAITSLAAPKTIANYFDGYFGGYSEVGAPKNIVLLEQFNSDSSKNYSGRIFYENLTDLIEVNGVATSPRFIGVYLNVNVDSNGLVTSISSYTEGSDSDDYTDLTIETSNYDVTGMTKMVIGSKGTQSLSHLGGGSLVHYKVIETLDNGQTSTFNTVRAYTHLGSGTLNGISYADLRGANRVYATGVRYRVSARGIGTVLKLGSDNSRPSIAVYYQANGTSGGSLVGTPFAEGAPLHGLFF